MKKRMLLWAPALFALGCAGGAKNTKADDKPAAGGAACCSDTAAAEAPPGKLLGLQALVTGEITDFDADNKTSGFGGYYQQRTKTFHARVSLRMIDSTTGEIWVAESGEGAANSKSTMVMGGGEMSEDQTLGKRALYMAV